MVQCGSAHRQYNVKTRKCQANSFCLLQCDVGTLFGSIDAAKSGLGVKLMQVRLLHCPFGHISLQLRYFEINYLAVAWMAETSS